METNKKIRTNVVAAVTAALLSVLGYSFSKNISGDIYSSSNE